MWKQTIHGTFHKNIHGMLAQFNLETFGLHKLDPNACGPHLKGSLTCCCTTLHTLFNDISRRDWLAYLKIRGHIRKMSFGHINGAEVAVFTGKINYLVVSVHFSKNA